MPAEKTYLYDVAISYAGEDRPYAESLAQALRLQGLKVFYDRYEVSTLWGKNLYDHLSDVYQHQARYCVMLLAVEKLGVLRTLTGHTGTVRSVAISSDGQRLFSGSADNTIKVWDLSNTHQPKNG